MFITADSRQQKIDGGIALAVDDDPAQARVLQQRHQHTPQRQHRFGMFLQGADVRSDMHRPTQGDCIKPVLRFTTVRYRLFFCGGAMHCAPATQLKILMVSIHLAVRSVLLNCLIPWLLSAQVEWELSE
jgi:hypothetical protein